MVFRDRFLACGKDGVQVFHYRVGRQPAGGGAAVHRAAGRVKAQPDGASRVDLGGQQIAAVVGEDVVVVAGGGATRSRQPTKAGRRGGVHRLRVDASPDRIE